MSTVKPSPPDQTSGASFSHLASRMGDEGEFQLIEDVRPFRVSGVLSLLFGLLSPLTYFGVVLVILPVIAIVSGVISVAKYDGVRPAGYRMGQIGFVLALFFGVFGLTIWSARRATLVRQAEYYARAYLDTMAVDQPETVLELAKVARNRTEAPLIPYYEANDDRKDAISSLKSGGIYGRIQTIQGETNWKPSRPTKITRGFHGVEKAEVCLVDAEGRIDLEAQIFLDLNRDRDGHLQWHVMHSQSYRELIVAKENY